MKFLKQFGLGLCLFICLVAMVIAAGAVGLAQMCGVKV